MSEARFPDGRSLRRISQTDDHYPDRLRVLARPPAEVFVRGRWPTDVSAVAIVGARRASPEGLAIARDLGSAAAEAGLWVISGGAIGIDAAAHAGSVESGGPTLAVLGTSLRSPGPKINRPLFEAIIRTGGGWLSEQAGPVHRAAFSQRNRLIAALADLVVVVEGREGSGTRHTLEVAQRLSRRMAAVTWAPGDPRGAQADWVFERNGVPVTGAASLLRHMGSRSRPTVGTRSRPTEGKSEQLMKDMQGLSAAEAFARLTALELEGP